MTGIEHPLVVEYLMQLRHEAVRLPREQADELIADIEAHLIDALDEHPTESQVREALDRLGSPSELVAAAGAPPEPTPLPEPQSRNRGRAEAGAAILLVLSAVIFPVWYLSVPMWIIGLVLLVLSARWNLGQKLLAAVALGALLPLTWIMLTTVGSVAYECLGQDCTPPDPGLSLANYLAIGFTIVWLAFVVWASVRLVRAARTA